MTVPMTPEEIEAFSTKLGELVDKKDESEAREYVNYHYPRLPESMRDEIFFRSLEGAVQEENAVLQDQEGGLAAIDSLQSAKEQIQKEGLT